MATSSELLTTGEVAKLLGTSRQQVVNLCERGDLPFVMVGKHRRVERSAAAAGNTRHESGAARAHPARRQSDCVVFKLVAGKRRDHAFANALIQTGLIDPAIVAARIDTLDVDPRVMKRLKRWIGMYTSAE